MTQYHFCHVVVPRNSFEEELAKALQAQGSCTHSLLHAVHIEAYWDTFVDYMLCFCSTCSMVITAAALISGVGTGLLGSCLVLMKRISAAVVYGLQLYFTGCESWNVRLKRWEVRFRPSGVLACRLRVIGWTQGEGGCWVESCSLKARHLSAALLCCIVGACSSVPFCWLQCCAIIFLGWVIQGSLTWARPDSCRCGESSCSATTSRGWSQAAQMKVFHRHSVRPSSCQTRH